MSDDAIGEDSSRGDATGGDGIEARIAAQLRAQREALGWSLGELAQRSGVSKTTIARVEQQVASPTAGLLGRLCSGLGITLSALMASAERADVMVWGVVDQPIWRDPETGLQRQVVGLPLAGGGADIARLTLAAGTDIAYPVPPRLALHQHLVMLAGRLRFTLGEDAFELAAGDCLAARVDRPTRFEVLGTEPAEYFVVIDRGRA